jgi:hypothetical protein
MADISEKKVSSIMDKLEELTDYDFEIIDNTYKWYRNKGHDRFKSIRLTWKEIFEDFFVTQYENMEDDDGWGFNTIKDWFFGFLYDMTGLDRKIMRQKYEQFRKSSKPYDALKKTILFFADMYFQELVKEK